MAFGDQKVFTINDSGVELKIIALDNGDGTVTFEIACKKGSLDVNALFLSDGDKNGNEKIATTINDKVDNSLNMNGTKVAWDESFGLSSTGLKGPASDKETFITEGDSYFTTQTVSFDSLQTLGIRATSVNGGDSIKGVGAGFEFIPAPDDTAQETNYFPTLDHGLSYATFYFAIDDDAALAAADLKGIKLDKGGHVGDGVYTVKVDFPGNAGTDLDTYYQSILDALVNNGNSPVSADSVVLGVGIHAGGGDPALSEVYYEVTGANPLDHLVQNYQVDQVYNYGDLVLA